VKAWTPDGREAIRSAPGGGTIRFFPGNVPESDGLLSAPVAVTQEGGTTCTEDSTAAGLAGVCGRDAAWPAGRVEEGSRPPVSLRSFSSAFSAPCGAPVAATPIVPSSSIRIGHACGGSHSAGFGLAIAPPPSLPSFPTRAALGSALSGGGGGSGGGEALGSPASVEGRAGSFVLAGSWVAEGEGDVSVSGTYTMHAHGMRWV